jgi:phenylacetate-CoA ligase
MIYDHPLLARAYRASPVALQHLFVTGYGAAKRWERASPTFRRRAAELAESQWWSADRLAALQAARLRALIRHAYDTVPYYRRVFDQRRLRPDDIQGPDDLYQLPLLTKEDVRRLGDDLRSRAVPPRRTTVGRTGGTTGVPLAFLLDRSRVAFDHALVERHWGWAGWRPGDWVVVLRGFPLVPPETRRPPFWRQDWADRRTYLSSFHLGGDNLARYAEQLRRWAPRFLAAYPSSLFTLARYLETIDERVPVHAVFTGSESLSELERRVIEDRFGPVFDRYGTGERLVVGQQCAAGRYHQNVEFGLLQVDEPAGVPAPAGGRGTLVHTGLTNHSMPLIRYLTDDVGQRADGACPCGRGLPLMGAVEGRKDDAIVTADGRVMPRAGLDQIHELVDGIERCQLVQREAGAVVIRVLPRPSFCPADRAELVRQLQLRVGRDTRVSVEVVDELPLTTAGKHRFIVSTVDVWPLPKTRSTPTFKKNDHRP